MIRPLTLITLLLAAGAGAYLFAVKHRAQMLDAQIAEISQASRLDAQRIRVLQAQWALETDPTRLQLLASQFTRLQPMQPAQLVTLASLGASLPPAGSAPPGGNPELPAQGLPPFGAPAAPDSQIAAAGTVFIGGLPLPPPQAPAAPRMLAMTALPPANAAMPMPTPMPMPMPANAPMPAAAPAGFAQTASLAPVVKPRLAWVAHRAPRAAPAGLAGSQLAEAVIPARAFAPTPIFAAGPAAISDRGQAVAVAAPARTFPDAADDSGSALGMAATDLPPPQPLQAGLAN